MRLVIAVSLLLAACTGPAGPQGEQGPPGDAGQTASAADGGGCGKDTDCKGDRICVKGRCVSPNEPPDLAILPDLIEADLELLSACGRPGDEGNALGVGRFCKTIADCQSGGAPTNLCTSLGNGPDPNPSDTYFCTIFPCQVDAGANACGGGAHCACQESSGGCSCVPDACD